jgi:hypothetical protein
MNTFEIAINQIHHPAVRRVMELNAWKIQNWREYASWKKHANRWVAIEWRQECRRKAAWAGFEIVGE